MLVECRVPEADGKGLSLHPIHKPAVPARLAAPAVLPAQPGFLPSVKILSLEIAKIVLLIMDPQAVILMPAIAEHQPVIVVPVGGVVRIRKR